MRRLAIDLVNRGYPVWYDNWEIELGDDFADRIQSGIEEGSFVLIVVSPASLESGWVQRELELGLAKEEELGRPVVLPIRYLDCKLPDSLMGRLYADFREAYTIPLDTLADRLEDAGVGETPPAPERELVPLVFEGPYHLDWRVLERRFEDIKHRLPPEFEFSRRQLVVSPDKRLDELRDRVARRVDNVTEDSYYSPELAQRLRSDFDRIRRLEQALMNGIRAILREARTSRGYGEVAAAYARLARTEIVSSLWSMQNPDDPSNSDYGSDGSPHPLSNNTSAARFFDVDAMELVKVGDPRGEYFAAWIDADSSAAQALEKGQGTMLDPTSYPVASEWLQAQMLWHHFARQNSPYIWDLSNTLMFWS